LPSKPSSQSHKVLQASEMALFLVENVMLLANLNKEYLYFHVIFVFIVNR